MKKLIPSVSKMTARIACLALFVSCAAQSQRPNTTSIEPASLKMFLQSYEKRTGGVDERTKFFDGWTDLDGDGKNEAIVELLGPSWCGTGGCTLLVLKSDNSSFKVVTKVTVARPPIRVLSRKSHGWRSLAVRVGGGGTRQAYEAELSFNGTGYPSNPSVAPASKLAEGVSGEVLIPESVNLTNGKALYP